MIDETTSGANKNSLCILVAVEIVQILMGILLVGYSLSVVVDIDGSWYHWRTGKESRSFVYLDDAL